MAPASRMRPGFRRARTSIAWRRPGCAWTTRTRRARGRCPRTKIVRRRRWPLLPPRLSDTQRAELQREANRKFRGEELAWIDLARFPDESASAYSTDFRDPAAHHALGAVRKRYHQLQTTRAQIAHDRPLDAALRGKLEGLGYLEDTPAPTSPRQGFVLPAPADRRATAPD